MPDVIWYQPTYSSTYHPGQQIIVNYRPTESSCDASFRLCTSNAISAPRRRREDSTLARRGCGISTWPLITRQKNGTCTTMLDPPSVQREQTFVLRMQTRSGSVWESPYFTLASSRKLSAPPDADGNSDAFPVPQGAGASENMPYSSSKSNPSMGDQIDLPVSSPSTNTPSSRTDNILTSRDSASNSTFTPSMLLSTSNPLSFAIPLGFVLSITFVAIIVAVYHFRKRVEKRTDNEKLATLSRFSSRDSMYKGPLEYPASAALPAHVSGPVPLFMAVDLDTPPAQETRRLTRKSVPVSASYTNVSAPSRESTKVIRGSRPLTVSRGSTEIISGINAGGENENEENPRK